jgi:Protein of unknown function DUF262
VSFQPPQPVAKIMDSVHNRAYVLPAIQREFVWSTDQIRLLFDSLLRGYPIGSFLFWKVHPDQASQFAFYDFLTEYHERDNPYASKTVIPPGQGVIAILDGQQRLTALNIGLYGSHSERLPRKWASSPDAYPKKHLYLNLLDKVKDDDELGMEYDFRFLTDREATPAAGQPFTWYRVGKILALADSGPAAMQELRTRQIDLNNLAAYNCLHALFRAIRETPAINYYLEESRDPDKVLDIFVRVNSAGTVLSYSDLLLSMATNQWKDLDAREEVRTLVKSLNTDCSAQFNFSKDRVLKAGLTLIEVPDVGFKVSNFTQKNMTAMEVGWESIRSALTVATLLLASFGFSERTLTADSVLIPLAYYVKRREFTDSYVTSSSGAADRLLVRRWVMRSLMKRGIWGSGLDTLITRLRETIREHGAKRFPMAELEQTMAALGKSLQFDSAEITELAQLKYGAARTFPVLATLYPGLDLTKSFHEDHVFPKSIFKPSKLRQVGIPSDAVDDFIEKCDLLPNLQLLAGGPNIEKQAKLPTDWLNGPHFVTDEQRRTYLAENDLNGLPLALDQFLAFYDDRRKRMEAKLRLLLDVQAPTADAAESTRL